MCDTQTHTQLSLNLKKKNESLALAPQKRFLIILTGHLFGMYNIEINIKANPGQLVIQRLVEKRSGGQQFNTQH